MPDTSVTISDPVSATVRSTLDCIAAVCTFLASPEGQLVCARLRSNELNLEQAIASGADAVVKFFKGL